MVESKAGKSNTALTVALIAVSVIAIVTGLYFFLNWQDSRPTTPPDQLEVTATADGEDVVSRPFSVCEFGAECPEGDVARIDATGAESIRISVPKDVAQQQWSVLSIYDDPAANTERTFTPGEADEVDIPLTTDNDGNEARLVVMEVSALLVGTDDNNEETPVVTTWAFTTEAS
ncbi:DUF2771 domain-containing protein [Corynebacterium urinipleomorphum]|uniref:DUF2771 domain-containing protein n=1 Tax=Corynebacterium urinipleomorphum TaxID=1852380 RepID=UPI000B351ECD|nr:DUF2771 domain-containing protein [Corynebacterium urinipleomorphum]